MKQLYLKLKIQKWQIFVLLFLFTLTMPAMAQISGPFDDDDVFITNTAIGDVEWTEVYDNDGIEDAWFDNGDEYSDAYDWALDVFYEYESDVDMEYRYHFSETYGAVIVEVIVTGNDDDDHFFIGEGGDLGADSDTYWHYVNLDGPFYAIASDDSDSDSDGGDPVVSFIYGDETLAGIDTDDSNFEDEDEYYSFEMFDFGIDAGETKRFLFIGGLGNIDDDNSNRPDRAYDAVQLLIDPANWPDDFASFLSDTEKNQVVNWDMSRFGGETLGVTCPPDITTNAEPGLCTKYINFDAPSHNLGPNVTITYRLTGASSLTIISNEYQDNSQANFNIGTTDVQVNVVQNEGEETYECNFSVTVIDRVEKWELFFKDDENDPHFYLDNDGEIRIYPTDFLDLSETFDQDEKCPTSMTFYFVERGWEEGPEGEPASQLKSAQEAEWRDVAYLYLDYDCSDVEDGHDSWDIVAVDQNGWESWLYDAEIYIENDAPVAQCTGDITLYLDEEGEVTLYPYHIDNNSWDDCGIDSMWLENIWEDSEHVIIADSVSSYTFNCDDEGDWFEVELGVNDYNSQDSFCTTWVYIEDDRDPTIETINDTTLYLSEFNGTASLSASVYDDKVDDNCGVDYTELSQTSFDCEDMGENTVTLFAEDYEGNTSTENFTVTVSDTTAPEIVCQDVTVYLEDVANGTATIIAEGSLLPPSEPDGVIEKSASDIAPEPPMENNDVVSTYWDNTDCLEFELSKETFECADVCEGTDCSTVTLTVTDEYGNTAECTPTITVIDSSAPHVITQNLEACLDENGAYELTADTINNGSWDNCSIDTMWLDVYDLSCVDTGVVHTVTLTVRDVSGNTASKTAEVLLHDCTAPDVVCNPMTVTLYENGEYVLNENDIAEIAEGTTDNCTPFDELVIDVFPKSFECIHVYDEMVPITVTVTDASGNSATCNTHIVVTDDIAPVVICKDVEVYLDNNGNARVYPLLLNDGNIISPEYARTFNNLAGGSYDACGIDSSWVSQSILDCSDVGSVEIELFMIDPSGNLSTCTSVVTVRDTLPPTISEVDNVELVVEPGVCETEIDYPEIVIDDKCDNTVLEQTAGLGAEGMFPLGVTTETWVATDESGNTSSVSFNVIITTTNAEPTLDAIEDEEIAEDTPSVTVDISGISYGNDCETQSVDVKASSTNPDLITNVDVIYTSGSTTGQIELTIAPNMIGTAEVTVTVEVSVSETVSETFTVTVTPVNDAPFVANPIADQTVNADHVLKVPISPVLGDIFDDIDDVVLAIDIMTEGGGSLPAWAILSGDTIVCTPAISDMSCVNIVVTATDAGGLSVSDTFEICAEGFAVSIGDLGVNQFEVQMYPNPTRGVVNLDISSGIHDVELSVLDITGKTVLRKQYSAAEKLTFDMSGKVSGMYFVHINTGEKQIVKKLVVDRK